MEHAGGKPGIINGDGLHGQMAGMFYKRLLEPGCVHHSHETGLVLPMS